MIINVGNRTDIPAYYSDWFYNRIKEGSVCARNPYFPEQVTRYRLDPSVVDFLIFCTKNPRPMFSRLDRLNAFGQYWQVTVTPYGREIEPRVPPVEEALDSLRELSRRVGKAGVAWRYDPIFISTRYSVDFHREAFARMAAALEGFTDVCIISFIDLYRKTLRNFPTVREVSPEDQRLLCSEMVRIAASRGMRLKTCAENPALKAQGADISGCVGPADLERLSASPLKIPPGGKSKREGCACLLENDIGAYNSCPHGCLYCYANANAAAVKGNLDRHNPASPLLIGELEGGDQIRDAVQSSYRDPQLGLF